MGQFLRRHDAGRRHVESGDAFDVWLARVNFGGADKPKPFDAVLFAALFQRGEFDFLARISRHDQLSRMAEGNIVLGAKFVRKAIALDAVPRLQRILRVIDAGVVYAAIARTRRHPELRKLLDEKNVLPAFLTGVSDRAAEDAAPDSQDAGLGHETRL